MKNIMYISPSTSVKGGISTVIKGYLNSDLSKNYNIFLVSSHVDGPKFIKLIQAILGLVETFFYLVFKKIDIVHIHGGNIISFKRKFYYIKVVRLFECKIIFHHHGGALIDQYSTASKKWKNRIKKTFEDVELVICLSENWRNSILDIAPATNIEVIPNSVKLPEVYNKKINNNVKLTFLGLIGENKGVFDLLKVVKRLVNEGIIAKLYIGGNGETPRLYREIEKLGIGNNVKYLGWISEEERDSLFKKTDVFILPSYSECFPMSILEAMSYGIPVISTYAGGIPELVSDGETGFLIGPGDIDALYEKLNYLIQNGKLRKRFGEKGRQVVSSRYNSDFITKQIDQIYNSL